MTMTGQPWLGAHPDDRAAIRSLIEHPQPGSLIILACPDTGLAQDIALAAAHTQLSADTAALDVRVAASDADRWTIAEVDERILRPATLRAFDRTHLIVADADQMAPAAFDHLLKTVEEPPSGAQFWFCIARTENLPATIRGRASIELAIRPAPPAEQIPLLIDAGCAPDLAAQLAAAAAGNLRLALSAATDPDRQQALARWAAARHSNSSAPTAEADSVLADILTLAATLPSAAATTRAQGHGPDMDARTPARARKARTPAAKASPRSATRTIRPKWDTLTPVQRVEGRRLIRAVLDRWEQADIDATATADSQELRQIEQRLAALAQARSELATNAPAATVLPALLARCSVQLNQRTIVHS